MKVETLFYVTQVMRAVENRPTPSTLQLSIPIALGNGCMTIQAELQSTLESLEGAVLLKTLDEHFLSTKPLKITISTD